MFDNEIRKLLIKQALYNLKRAYTPPPGGGMDPSMMMGGGAPPGGGMDPAMMGGMPGAGMPGMDPMMMGGAGAPPGGDTSALPPPDVSGIDPSMTGGAGGSPGGTSGATAQLQAAIAVLKEGLRQLEKAVDQMGGGGETPKEASYHGSYFQAYDPMQQIMLYLHSLG